MRLTRSAQHRGRQHGVAATAPARSPLSAGEVGTLAQVPWAEIGPGWALGAYTIVQTVPDGSASLVVATQPVLTALASSTGVLAAVPYSADREKPSAQ